jgi:predicted nucleic acid-binding protein
MSVDFIDSNVFVYLFDDVALQKRATAEKLVKQALMGGSAVISHQVVQETLNVVTRKLRRPLTPDDARRFMDGVLAPLWRVMPSTELFHRGLDLQARLKYGFYDSLIVSAALTAGCTRLYSEDLQDGQVIEGLRIVNPFAATETATGH